MISLRASFPIVSKSVLFLSVSVLGLLLLGGCSFKSPSAKEGQVLLERGAFPSTVPSWVNQSASINPRISSAGFVPRGYGVPPAVARSRSRGGSGMALSQSGVKEILKNAERKENADMKESNSSAFDDSNAEEELSPLAAIAAKCPQVEKDVSDALQITDINSRIKRYEILSRRCSASSHLWVWLGRDYKAVGDLRDAQRCFERALVADPSNMEAEDLLLETKTKLAN